MSGVWEYFAMNFAQVGYKSQLRTLLSQENHHLKNQAMWKLLIAFFRFIKNTLIFNHIHFQGKYQNPEFFSEEIKDFLKKILIREQDKRPNLNELLEHPWIVRNCSEKKEDKSLYFNKLKLL